MGERASFWGTRNKKKAFFEGVVGQDVNQPPGLLSLLFLNGNGLRHRELKGKERKEMPVPNNFLFKKAFRFPIAKKRKRLLKSSTSRSTIMACCRRTWSCSCYKTGLWPWPLIKIHYIEYPILGFSFFAIVKPRNR